MFLWITFTLNGQPEAALMSAGLGAACLAFLVFNFSPASIFMADFRQSLKKWTFVLNNYF